MSLATKLVIVLNNVGCSFSFSVFLPQSKHIYLRLIGEFKWLDVVDVGGKHMDVYQSSAVAQPQLEHTRQNLDECISNSQLRRF